MKLPTLAIVAAVLSESDGITVGLAFMLDLVVLGWGETRVHVSSLREWRREAEVKIASQASQIAAMEIRESRTVARLDHLAEQLKSVDSKLDRLLERHVPPRDVA